MEGKVLLIDFQITPNRLFIEMLHTWLSGNNFQVIEFCPDNLDFYKREDIRTKISIDKSVELAKQVDVVFVHFGSMQRVDAAEVLNRFKSTGAKVIVESVSSILFEAADYVFFMDVKEMQENIKIFCREKNRGK